MIRNAARGDTAPSLSRLDASGADAELIELAKHCLEPEAFDRPRDANAVSERLTAYLTGVQERLRTAELARVEAQARAEEEAKRRVLADELTVVAQGRAVAEARRRRATLGLEIASALAFVAFVAIAVGSVYQARLSAAYG